MPRIDRYLLSGEQILYRSKLHLVIFVYPLTLMIATCVIYLWLPTFIPNQPKIVLFFTGATGLMAIYYWLLALVRYFSTSLTLTNKRFLISSGLIRLQSLEIFLAKIETFTVRQGIIGKMSGFGKIIIGTGGNDYLYRQVTNPLALRSHVQIEVEKLLNQGYVQRSDGDFR